MCIYFVYIEIYFINVKQSKRENFKTKTIIKIKSILKKINLDKEITYHKIEI
jgi:hypothetical protein